MVTALQFVAIAIFLIWGLASSLCDLLARGQDEAQLVRREHGSAHGAAGARSTSD